MQFLRKCSRRVVLIFWGITKILFRADDTGVLDYTLNDQNCLRNPTFKRQLWAQILTKLHEPKMDSTLFFLPLSSGVHEFCYKKSPSMLVFCSIYCRDHIYNLSLFGNCLPSDSIPNQPNLYVYNLFGVIWCWFDCEQAISMYFHTFNRD